MARACSQTKAIIACSCITGSKPTRVVLTWQTPFSPVTPNWDDDVMWVWPLAGRPLITFPFFCFTPPKWTAKQHGVTFVVRAYAEMVVLEESYICLQTFNRSLLFANFSYLSQRRRPTVPSGWFFMLITMVILSSMILIYLNCVFLRCGLRYVP